MSGPRRLFVDVSYTRTQTGNVGITRTVRRMTDALRSLEAETNLSCGVVSFHTSGFRHSPAAIIAGPSSAKRGSPARLFRWLSSGRIRTVLTLCLPLPLLHSAWALTTRSTFDGVSAGEAPVKCGAGDWLLLAVVGSPYGSCGRLQVEQRAWCARSTFALDPGLRRVDGPASASVGWVTPLFLVGRLNPVTHSRGLASRIPSSP